MPEWDHDESDDDEAGAENSGNSGVDRAKIIEYRSRNGWKVRVGCVVTRFALISCR